VVSLQSKKEEEPFQTTDADLAGFWDMVLLQVADVDRMFNELDELRRHDWNVKNARTVNVSSSVLHLTVTSLVNCAPALMREAGIVFAGISLSLSSSFSLSLCVFAQKKLKNY